MKPDIDTIPLAEFGPDLREIEIETGEVATESGDEKIHYWYVDYGLLRKG